MTQHIDTYNGSGSGPTTATISLPANLVGSSLSVTAVGGRIVDPTTFAYDPGAYVGGNIDKSLFPLTAVMPIPTAPTAAGGNGFSGGGGRGGGGSTGVLSGSTLLLEAGGRDAPIDPTLGNPPGAAQGSGGGYASNTPAAGNYYAAGSGGAQGGSGGSSSDGEPGGTGHGGGTTGNNGVGGSVSSGGTNGAGVGSGGLAVPNCGACYAASSVSAYQYGTAPSAETPGVIVIYNVADAPSAPLLDGPTASEYLDTNADGVAFTGTYQTPGSDTGALSEVCLSLVTDSGSTHYWNGTDFSSTSPVWVTPNTGVGATNGEEFTVVVPAGVLADGHTYTYSFACQESYANLQGSFATGVSFYGEQAPTLTILSPTGTQTTLTPTMWWSPTTPAGSQTDYRVVVYDAATSSPGSGSPVYDSGLVASSSVSFTFPSGHFNSVQTYYGYIQITETGGQTSAWVEFTFTVQLVDSATPTLTGTITTEPTSGCPCAHLTATTSGGTASPSVRFQVSADGGTTWSDVVGLGAGAAATSLVVVSGGSASIYDMGAPFNVPLRYRARNEAVSGGETYVSAWSTTLVLGTVSSDYWWLIVPTNLVQSIQLTRLQSMSSSGLSQSKSGSSAASMPPVPSGMHATLVSDEAEQQGRFNGFGVATATVIHGDIWAEEFVLDAYFATDAEFQAFRAIRALKEVVLLKWDMNGETSWINFGDVRPTAILQETGRRVATKRGMAIQCIPAAAVTT